MKNIFTSTFMVLVVLSFCLTACQKEQINTNALTPVSEEQRATSYLENSPTKVTFAALEINHDTYHINGFVMDNQSNRRTIDMKEATFLNLNDPNLSNYFTEHFYNNSEVVESLDIVEMAANVKKSRALKVHDGFSSEEAKGNTSKVYLAFKPNSFATEHEGCGASDNSMTNTFVSKVILAAEGRLSYQPKLEVEQELVNWLMSFEAEIESEEN